jgi:LemA protein
MEVFLLKGWIIAGVVVALLLVMGISGYNSLVSMNENVNGKWAQVENQLQRRADLIPNLVSTVQGMAAQERAVIQSVADARAKLAGAQGPAAKAEANDQLSGALSRLLVVVENYPTIKSDKSFLGLQDELAGTENRLAVARKDYNDAVQGFNAKIQSFPSVLYARMLGFSPKEYFRAAEGAKQVPQVKF